MESDSHHSEGIRLNGVVEAVPPAWAFRHCRFASTHRRLQRRSALSAHYVRTLYCTKYQTVDSPLGASLSDQGSKADQSFGFGYFDGKEWGAVPTMAIGGALLPK